MWLYDECQPDPAGRLLILAFNRKTGKNRIQMVNGIKAIDKQSFVSDIVKKNYRTAVIFRSHGIEYCCGAKFPLELVCSLKGLDPDLILEELESASRTVTIPNTIKFEEWDLSFLADYIVHIHHAYLRSTLPTALETIRQFADGHKKKFTNLPELVVVFSSLVKELLSHIKYEEEIIFPYIKQIAHAHKANESYASLLVRTLSKPVEEVMNHEHKFVEDSLARIRELTEKYQFPAEACTSHKVSFLTLQDLESDILQHLHLENDILFPRAIKMEKELLGNPYS
jgi:regulator of cell morphogenesis and NO signaling